MPTYANASNTINYSLSDLPDLIGDWIGRYLVSWQSVMVLVALVGAYRFMKGQPIFPKLGA